MRINTVFSKKVTTGEYENETFTVTMEAESEFNHIEQIADYLFHQAREAVMRQVEGVAAGGATLPETSIPGGRSENKSAQQQQAQPGSGQFKATEKQINMLRKLFDESFSSREDARAWLKENTGLDSTAFLTRKQASAMIEKLVDKTRSAI